MTTQILQLLDPLSISARLLLIFIISGFMPLSAMTFFYHLLKKKEADFKKAMEDMGLSSDARTVHDTFRWTTYILPVAFVSLICLLIISYVLFADVYIDKIRDNVLLAGSAFGSPDAVVVIKKSIVAVAFAFLGGYVWAANVIIRRLTEHDISPNNYYSAGIRILLASTISVALSFILGDLGGSALPAISFLAGMFPERIMNYLIEQYKSITGGLTPLDQQLSLENIQGISLQHKERLQEIGIDNAQNLASYSLIQLLKKTPFETRELLDWIGQAKLLVYVPADIEKYRAIGLRSAFDFLKGDKNKVNLTAVAQNTSVGINPQQMAFVYEQIVNNDGIQSLNSFLKNMDQPASNPTTLEREVANDQASDHPGSVTDS